MDWSSLFAALGGGILGAAIGAVPVFVLTGLLAVLGVVVALAGGGTDFISHIAFGPCFGPHVSFAAGAAAAAYASRRGYLKTGRDIGTPLMGLDHPDILAIGGLFGIGGYLFNLLLTNFNGVAWTDTVAVTVTVSAIVARLIFGKTSLFGSLTHPGARRFTPDEVAYWVPWQQRPWQLAAIGLGVGLASAHLAQFAGQKGGGVFGFGVAAVVLGFGSIGHRVPVTHHIALPAAAAVGYGANILVAGVIGIVCAFVGEAISRLFLIHGDTHIDPPAFTIAIMITLFQIARLPALHLFA